MRKGIELISKERERQITEEGYDEFTQEAHGHQQLAGAALCYLANYMNKENVCSDNRVLVAFENTLETGQVKIDEDSIWPWSPSSDKREKHDANRSLEIAGALIAAELDRINGSISEDAYQQSIGAKPLQQLTSELKEFKQPKPLHVHVVSCNYGMDFQTQIQEAIEDGWELWGDHQVAQSSHSTIFTQLMVKYE